MNERLIHQVVAVKDGETERHRDQNGWGQFYKPRTFTCACGKEVTRYPGATETIERHIADGNAAAAR